MYAGSRYKKLFVDDRPANVPPRPSDAGEKDAVRKFGFGQWWTLVRRNYLVKVRDRAQAAILLVQAPLFGLLVGAVFGRLKFESSNEWGTALKHATGIEFLMVVAAIWFGCNNVARDIVGEWTVFQRERMVSLKLPSYVFSKLAVAAVICLFQCLTLLGIVSLMCHLQGSFFATFGILYLSSLVGAALGLCVSARTSTTEAAIAMLPLILLPIITLGGGMTPPASMPVPMPQIAKIFPSRWAMEANLLLEAKQHSHAIYSSPDAATEGAAGQSFTTENDPEQNGCDLAEVQFPKLSTECLSPAPDPKSPPKSDRPELGTSFAVLGGMLVFWVTTALVFLKMRDIQ